MGVGPNMSALIERVNLSMTKISNPQFMGIERIFKGKKIKLKKI